ncbi:MAG: LytR family transcriptional regulator, partial [Chloroflexi bacterium]
MRRTPDPKQHRRSLLTGTPPPSRYRLFGRIILGLAILMVAVVGIGYWQIHQLARQIVVADPRGSALASPLLGANILVVGVDIRRDRPEDGVRSDTLMLVRLDGRDGWINLLSIPRDTQIDLPERGPSKINAAYAYGYLNA